MCRRLKNLKLVPGTNLREYAVTSKPLVDKVYQSQKSRKIELFCQNGYSGLEFRCSMEVCSKEFLVAPVAVPTTKKEAGQMDRNVYHSATGNTPSVMRWQLEWSYMRQAALDCVHSKSTTD